MKFLQGIKKRRKHILVRLCQYDFPDTKCFGGNVLDDKVTINASMEIYCKKLLSQLSELSNDTEQLICCLHFAAGSGKSTVIKLVLLYAQEYCSYLPNVMFCCNTIVVTAMTGVTATIICGEAMHGALF